MTCTLAAILLGHLKLSLSEIRQALYLLDETVLTPELLKQLLAYAPNKNEVGHKLYRVHILF